MIKKHKVLIIYIAAMVIFCVYLLLINNIIGKATNEDLIPKKIKISTISSVCTPLVNVEGFYKGGMTETMFFEGWAFCETEQDNSGKQIDIILKDISSDTAYICGFPAIFRPDFYNALHTSYKVYNDMCGISFNVYTFNIPTGRYELYINVKENEADYGMASTGLFFEKTVNDFHKVDIEDNTKKDDSKVGTEDVSLSEPKEIDSIEFGSYGQAYIDAINSLENSTYIVGWGTYSNETNVEQKLYAELVYSDGFTIYYPVNLLERPDLAEYFGDDSYRYCGFEVNIPKIDADKECLIRMIAEINNKFYRLNTSGTNVN